MRAFFALLFFLSCCWRLQSQEINTEAFIKAWKADDTSQTHKAAVYYDLLDYEKDTVKYWRTLGSLQNYLKVNPNKRIRARVLMYEVFGAMVFQFQHPKYVSMLEEAMRIASELKDDQLMAEIYVYYAEVTGHNNQLLYNLKAIEIQRRIGFEHFTTVQNRFFIVSSALYHSKDYRQSIRYGLGCLGFVGTDQQHWLKRIYILQLDILGSAYKKLGKYDSTVYYYQKILDTLRVDPYTGFMQSLWTGIARGNIGHCNSLQQNDGSGIPLMKEYLHSSIEVDDRANVSIAANMLGNTYFRLSEHEKALQAWWMSYHFADKSEPTDYLLEATKGISSIYRRTGNQDSAFYYYDLHHTYSDALDSRLDESRLSAINARITFDNMQASLVKYQTALDQSKTILRLTIAGISLLLVVLLLLYNRYRLKNKYRLESERRKIDQAEQRIEYAKKQIAGFMDHINEKDNLINSMEEQLRQNQQSRENRATMEKLSQYVLVSEEEWEKFRVEFSNAYPNFFQVLRQRIPQITPAEERLSALIFLQINNYQIAKMLGIERDSVFRAKRRLRQRLGLPETTMIDEYIYNILKVK